MNSSEPESARELASEDRERILKYLDAGDLGSAIDLVENLLDLGYVQAEKYCEQLQRDELQ